MGGRSDYEERRKRRIERYKELSLKAQERSSQYSNSNANRILQIAPGQPILVGHHSEKRHRRLIKKAQDDIRKSIEEDNKSNFYKERAENAENSEIRRLVRCGGGAVQKGEGHSGGRPRATDSCILRRWQAQPGRPQADGSFVSVPRASEIRRVLRRYNGRHRGALQGDKRRAWH